MNVSVAPQIIIRHVSGAKANQIELIPLADAQEISIGREAAAKIAFTDPGDDIVSRRHAAIRITASDPLTLMLSDLGSSNGTYLNGEKIAGEREILPEDTIQLGKNGPKFVLDIQPRPAKMQARTRMIDVEASNATRIMKAAETVTATVTAEVATNARTKADEVAAAKAGVGKNTVLHMLSEERKTVNRSWMSAVAALAAFVVLGGGAFYWKHLNDQATQQAALERVRQDDQQTRVNSESLKRNLGSNAQEIVQKYGNSVVHVSVLWRLYDRTTGKPIFHKTIRLDGRDYPAYVRIGNSIVRWLTLDDEERSNLPIGGEHTGSGFVVGEQGFILTNKHVASSWSLGYDGNGSSGQALLYNLSGGPGNRAEIARLKEILSEGVDSNGKRLTRDARAEINKNIAKLETLVKFDIINLNTRQYNDVTDWVPESGGIIFQNSPAIASPVGEWNIADPTSNQKRNFSGRNDLLEVRFAGGRVPVNANLLRTSSEADVALIKIDTPQALTKVDLATETPQIGERAFTLGYPGVARRSFVQTETIERGQSRRLTDIVYEPFITDGIISLITSEVKTENGVRTGGLTGALYQLSINSTGSGNSGGPVFNKDSQVIGLFTYTVQSGGAYTSAAVPIKYGRDLLQSQRP